MERTSLSKNLRLVPIFLALSLAGAACADEAQAPSSDAPTQPAESSETDDATSQAQVRAPTPPKPATCSDTCPKKGGIDWRCKLRFMYGINYAWSNFGSDFGGNTKWNQPGVSNNPKVDGDLKLFRENGSSVIRWWVFPDFRGDGVKFDAQDRLIGLGGTAIADLNKALELAEKHNLYLMLTMWSFDNFRPTKDADGIRARGIKPYVVDAAKRAELMNKVVRPFARAAGQSPYAERLIAWDVINEPEWAMTGPSLYGDEKFDANPELEAVSHKQMETFLADTIKVFREETRALISVGGAAVKWKKAWSKLDIDFNQFHIYDWVNDYWKYSDSPAQLGVTDYPWVMGEFPMGGLKVANYATLVNSWYNNGYAGALGWAYSDDKFRTGLGDVKAFAQKHACEVSY